MSQSHTSEIEHRYEIEIPHNIMLLPANPGDECHEIFAAICSKMDEKHRILIENIKSIPSGDSVKSQRGQKSGFVRGYKSDVIELLTEFLFQRFNIDKKIVSINTLQRLQNVIFGKSMAKQKANDFLNNDVLDDEEKAAMLHETYAFKRSIIPSDSPDLVGDEQGRRVLLSSINFRALDTRREYRIPQFSRNSVLFSTRPMWFSLLDFYELIDATHFKNTDKNGELLMQNVLQQYASHLEYIIRKNKLYDVFENNVLKTIKRKANKTYNKTIKRKEQEIYENQAMSAVLSKTSYSSLNCEMVMNEDIDDYVTMINKILDGEIYDIKEDVYNVNESAKESMKEVGYEHLDLLKDSGNTQRSSLIKMIPERG